MPRHSDLLQAIFLLCTLVSVSCSKNTGSPDGPLVIRDLTPLPPRDLNAPDLTAGPPDLSDVRCVGKVGKRLCDVGNKASGACSDTDGGPSYQPDRVCQGNGCDTPTGYCNPPKIEILCNNDKLCQKDMGDLSCQVFTNVFNQYHQYCAPPPGNLGKMNVCQKDSDCRWNLCYPFNQALRCMQPCASDDDCGGVEGACGPLMAPVEGSTDTIQVCAQ